jgi:phage baseplate assembly protein gpV
VTNHRSDLPTENHAGFRRKGAGRRWLVASAAVWAVLLMAAAGFSARHDAPTVREQRDLAAADTVVDTALGAVLAAAHPWPVLEITSDLVSPGCRITPFRDGASLSRRLLLALPEHHTTDALTLLAQRLPAGYRASVAASPGAAPTLQADAGGFVSVRGIASAPDTITVTVDSGCRPPARLAPAPSVDERDRAVLAPVAAALGGSADQFSAVQVPCPGGGTARAVTATVAGVPVQQRWAPALRAISEGTVVLVDDAARFAYRTATGTVTVRRDSDRLAATAVTGCP